VSRLGRAALLGAMLGILDALGRTFSAWAGPETFGDRPTFGGCVNSALLGGGDGHFIGPSILDVLLAAAVVYLGYRFLRSRRSSSGKDKRRDAQPPNPHRQEPPPAPRPSTNDDQAPDAGQSAKRPTPEKPQWRRPANRFEAAQQTWDMLSSGDAQQPSRPKSGGVDQDDLLRGAKVVYVRIRTAVEKNALEEVREFATPEALDQLGEIAAGLSQTTPSHILLVNARVLDISELGPGSRVRVEFSALIRDSDDDEESRETKEIWRFVRRDAKDTWRLEAIEHGESLPAPAQGETDG
jgi:predicted lipid-binding transport protein (Tim44 family)